MLSRMSLPGRIRLVGLLPLLAFASALGLLSMQQWSRYQGAKTDLGNSYVIQHISSIVGPLQVERGLTAVYLKSSDKDLSRVVGQREKVDEAVRKFNEYAASLKRNSAVESTHKALSRIQEHRAAIGPKSEFSATLKGYTSIVLELLGVIQGLSENMKGEGAASVRSILILESAKENSGKLRANLSSALEQNTALRDSVFRAIVSLKAGVDSNLNSPLLKTSDNGSKLLEQFYESNHWQEVNSVFRVVLTKADEGSFGYSSKDFFTTISKSINALSEIISSETDELRISLANEMSRVRSTLINQWVVTAIVFVLFQLFNYFVTKQLRLTLSNIIQRLEESSRYLRTSVVTMSGRSKKMASSSSEQAAAVQQTVSFMGQIDSTTHNNHDQARQSVELSGEVRNQVTTGNEDIKRLSDAMDRIDRCYQKVQGLEDVMKTIEERTSVIDHIVFKTKILSFNASIEAQRAGAHGRGFAVVAEEVGNLAALSGQSATDISKIVRDSIEQTGKISKESMECIKQGYQLLEVAKQRFDSINLMALDLEEQAKIILGSSKEQLTGVEQVSDAMKTIDESIQDVSRFASESSEVSDSLSAHSDSLFNEIGYLAELVAGKAKADELRVADVSEATDDDSSSVISIHRGDSEDRNAA